MGQADEEKMPDREGTDQPSSDELTLAAAARQAARRTFLEFADDRSSLYYQAPGMTPEMTWEAIREEVAAVSALAAAKGARKEPIASSDVIEWHRAIFQRSFPEQCGELRDHEENYGYVVGTPEKPVLKVGRGTGWRRVPRRLREICVDFNREAEQMDVLDASRGLRLVDATRAAARLYAKFLSIHPFEDGNGRTGYAILGYALVRAQAVAVELPDYAELQWALGRALQPGGKRAGVEPLAELLAQKIRASHTLDLS